MPLDHGCLSLIKDQSPMAQSVARQAVNLQVAGSNPAGGVLCVSVRCRPVVRIPGFHPGDPGSNPGGGGVCMPRERMTPHIIIKRTDNTCGQRLFISALD